MWIAWKAQSQFTIPWLQATNEVLKVNQPLKQNPTQNKSAAPLDLGKDMDNVYMLSV